ncbi:RNA polymerase sigma factor [Bacillus weihaiensis]|uniref:RNA polymerase sigma factor n=1 Tax=Bacillus weihaiensis TaxID=1547283 RepID=UPI002352EF77|nr:RNA polymerase sigma factor [Bacillus weihaiensis]
MKLVKKIQKKSSEAAANELIAMYYHEMFSFVYKQTVDRELAKDLTQEIFISMLKTIHGFDGRATFRTWLYKIANSRLIDFYRSKQYRLLKQSYEWNELLQDEGRTFTLDIEKKEEVQSVMNVLLRFPEENQQIVRLKFFGEQTFTEIAHHLGLVESTVKTKYYSTIRKLQKLLKEE